MKRKIEVGDVYDYWDHLVAIVKKKMFGLWDYYKIKIYDNEGVETKWKLDWFVCLSIGFLDASYIGKLKPRYKRIFSKQIRE